mmetsp:Transcript_32262/g.97227  ORF Transcript_32262/g.97227 Transcript_32262/m.97227 type:complete len:271 (+) Transcript_32262:153-965(+)
MPSVSSLAEGDYVEDVSLDASAGVAAELNRSLELLGVEFVDLALIHWPGSPRNRNAAPVAAAKRADMWRGLEDAHRNGLARAIGVSNFTAVHLKGLAATARVMPMVNQIEVHPYNPEETLVHVRVPAAVRHEGDGLLSTGVGRVWAAARPSDNGDCGRQGRRGDPERGGAAVAPAAGDHPRAEVHQPRAAARKPDPTVLCTHALRDVSHHRPRRNAPPRVPRPRAHPVENSTSLLQHFAHLRLVLRRPLSGFHRHPPHPTPSLLLSHFTY